MVAKDEKANIGSSIIVRKVGALTMAAATIAAAHKSEVMMLTRLNSFFILIFRPQSIAERAKSLSQLLPHCAEARGMTRRRGCDKGPFGCFKFKRSEVVDPSHRGT